MIPTYNQSEFIEAAVRSALQQTYANLEVIVGDDASTDATEALIGAIQDTRLRYVRHPYNLGRVGNYRKLLYEYVSGDYVVNLDGDDYFTDVHFISDAVDLIVNSETPPRMIVARVLRGDSGKVSEIPTSSALDGLEVLAGLPREEFALMHMAVLYHVADARQCDFYRSPAISSDWESLYRLMPGGKVIYLDRNVGVWRQHGDNQTATVNVDEALTNLDIWRSIFDHAAEQGMPRLRAAHRKNLCIAFFALRYLVEISKRGNTALLKALGRFLCAYPSGLIYLLFNPKSIRRLSRSFAGFDRTLSS